MRLSFSYYFNPPIPCGMGHQALRLDRNPNTDFNPPIPCGMGHAFDIATESFRVISIHPSRVGWDFAAVHVVSSKFEFQSTHPVWDGTLRRLYPFQTGHISIHPSRVGWDICRRISATNHRTFQSTHPVWDGTAGSWWWSLRAQISIHPSRVGWDKGVNIMILSDYISIHPSRVGWDSKKYMITYISCDSYPFCQIFRLHKMTAYSYS